MSADLDEVFDALYDAKVGISWVGGSEGEGGRAGFVAAACSLFPV